MVSESALGSASLTAAAVALASHRSVFYCATGGASSVAAGRGRASQPSQIPLRLKFQAD